MPSPLQKDVYFLNENRVKVEDDFRLNSNLLLKQLKTKKVAHGLAILCIDLNITYLPYFFRNTPSENLQPSRQNLQPNAKGLKSDM